MYVYLYIYLSLVLFSFFPLVLQFLPSAGIRSAEFALTLCRALWLRRGYRVLARPYLRGKINILIIIFIIVYVILEGKMSFRNFRKTEVFCIMGKLLKISKITKYTHSVWSGLSSKSEPTKNYN